MVNVKLHQPGALESNFYLNYGSAIGSDITPPIPYFIVLYGLEEKLGSMVHDRTE